MRKHFGCFCPVGCNLSCPQLTAHQLQLGEGRRVGVHLPECDGDETRLGRAKCFGMCQPCVYLAKKDLHLPTAWSRVCVCSLTCIIHSCLLVPGCMVLQVALLILFLCLLLLAALIEKRKPKSRKSCTSAHAIRDKFLCPLMPFFCLYLRITLVRVYVYVCVCLITLHLFLGFQFSFARRNQNFNRITRFCKLFS